MKGFLTKRLAPVLIGGIILLGVVIGFYPEQAAVFGRKIGMASVGFWLGYVAYLSAYRSKILPTDNEVELMRIKAFLMGVGGLCVSVAV